MTLKTSKGKTYEINWIGGPTVRTGNVLLEMKDDRSLANIAREFDKLEWMERTSETEGDKRFEGFARLVGIQRGDGGNVTLTFAKE